VAGCARCWNRGRHLCAATISLAALSPLAPGPGNRPDGKGCGPIPLQLGPYSKRLQPWDWPSPSRVEPSRPIKTPRRSPAALVAIPPGPSRVQGSPVLQLAVQGGSLERNPNRQASFGCQPAQRTKPPPAALRCGSSIRQRPVKPLQPEAAGGRCLSVALHRSASPGREQPLLPPKAALRCKVTPTGTQANVRPKPRLSSATIGGSASPCCRTTQGHQPTVGCMRPPGLSRSDVANSLQMAP